ncbi:MAG: DUF4861 domain-containing protein [Melioribacteraceae bacterium]|nr:DUF4861 domain-containing protein [Melioribacteraceae bacterium]
MKKILSVISLIIIVSGCSTQSNIRITLTNPSSFDRSDALVEIDKSTLVEMDNEFEFDSFIILDGYNEIPYQVTENKVLFVTDIKANQEKEVLFVFGGDIKPQEYETRTYAELAMKPDNKIVDGKFRGDHFVNVTDIKVPSIHKDHDALFKYEGPGWESELVGYRFYLDWRNATDIFGKKKIGLVLKKVGVTDTVAQDDSYHEMQDWGMDIFKVGNSLGIGSIGMWNDGKVYRVEKTDSIFCKISQNGPVRSQVKTKYYGWNVGQNKYDLISTLSIAAGSRLTKNELEITGEPENISTGLAKYEGTKFLEGNTESEWSYIGLYGRQTLADDDLGIAVLFRSDDLIELNEDELSHVVKLRPVDGKLTYYFCAAWEKEPDGIKSEEEFINYLIQTADGLSNKIEVK